MQTAAFPARNCLYFTVGSCFCKFDDHIVAINLNFRAVDTVSSQSVSPSICMTRVSRMHLVKYNVNLQMP
jgi:hypothetical protein